MTERRSQAPRMDWSQFPRGGDAFQVSLITRLPRARCSPEHRKLFNNKSPPDPRIRPPPAATPGTIGVRLIKTYEIAAPVSRLPPGPDEVIFYGTLEIGTMAPMPDTVGQH